ncbi:hypothetical protein RchiOBHm_Chr1g0378401 [Rosa chinensis]|uniref:Uncharacterized protein n=1 Tax=Rosa chinensis TaxID=74649 RepID=A0A2P6SNG8_ROSCH|nr:hypothetical protein RchiOBHm_Chr1g0378401 [Rosa chinensis]
MLAFLTKHKTLPKVPCATKYVPNCLILWLWNNLTKHEICLNCKCVSSSSAC